MNKPRKAVILAAGFGSRLAPMTLHCPKPLVPFEGEPMLFRVLRQLKQWGVREVCINLHHGADRLVEALLAKEHGLRICLSYEPELLGTGGVLRRMSWFLDQPFWMCNADVATELNPGQILRHHAQAQALATLWMIPDKGPRSVSLRERRIQNFRKQITGADHMTFSGLHLLTPDILDYLPVEERFSTIVEAYELAMKKGKEVHGLPVPRSFWADLGTVGQLEEAHRARGHHGPLLWGCDRPPRGSRHLVTDARLGLWPDEQKLLPHAGSVEHLPARGSDRSFRRVWEGRQSQILIRRGTARPENDRLGPHTQFLRQQGIRVPRIYLDQDQLHLVEDLGTRDLLSLSPQQRKRKMPMVIGLVADFHRERVWRAAGRQELEAPFSPALYRWEQDLFLREFMARHDPTTDQRALRHCLNRLAGKLTALPRVLLHRDLQSTNLLFKGEEVALIDFQGMRLGPAAYDLGSLFADPYVEWTEKEQRSFLARYNALADRAVDEREYRFGCAQRLCQALGAYGRLGAIPATRRFQEHIPAAVRQLYHNCRAVPALTELAEWAENYRKTHAF